ncbi:MaoC family dehydratase N-terminal domain-containing protein [Pseudomonas sp. CCI3.2]|uniref:FAS1-like dehydratase domain-containing protein n=1 Tax=unclassified Pseudomonas TaxID=196821 RepID=UPI002AC89961|nr:MULTISPECIES: MaoC family dehydratase N-terminal domain-containing protein [unclassified Pseudomonas]MEB0076456.1 MaoC family dehydratase N-terminal domain-containing protein [Pseudomonas sp. MH10out]MEB0100851.1 MaoC family dehydratase N-terminal domain-containing protein [Pseudomonas sp. CCI3.2]MEB0128764.1 MaoC family dehydratase N-terminal domain-containing protein [Pseudomonas sp. CCI2.4]MEB0157009.1 MaoC family dehydratase N-terminal domain-containing protein [Pseudomonas sp. AH2 (2023
MSAADFTAWLGRTEEAQDQFSRNLIKRIAATFGEDAPVQGAALPLLWQWCFFQEPLAESQLGSDGHPARGGFLPPAENRNRMWAGGRIEFIEPLRVGANAQRLSTITHIEEKIGRTGALLFVTVRHDYSQDGRLAIREEQDIVYREPNPPKQSSGQALEDGDWRESIEPTPTLLFRYSAVTFNGHRIHYDYPYVTGIEGYAGLVVHGPMIATLSLRAFCRANPSARVRHFSYRGERPLITPQLFSVGGRILETGKAQLWAGNDAGIAQSAEVLFD